MHRSENCFNRQNEGEQELQRLNEISNYTGGNFISKVRSKARSQTKSVQKKNINTHKNVKHPTSFAACVNKERIGILGRGARSKSKRHSLKKSRPEMEIHQCVTYVFEEATEDSAEHLYSWSSYVNSLTNLLKKNSWNPKCGSLTGKKLLEEAKRHLLDICREFFNKRQLPLKKS
ncbi:unnamed protein product [Clavelina lepadiformis]|uniref:Uncharacterized protein n=1 Tax=Clavelina lepadiformis TaxID=159417 RepID=A0ABP0FU96_CLALP